MENVIEIQDPCSVNGPVGKKNMPLLSFIESPRFWGKTQPLFRRSHNLRNYTLAFRRGERKTLGAPFKPSVWLEWGSSCPGMCFSKEESWAGWPTQGDENTAATAAHRPATLSLSSRPERTWISYLTAPDNGRANSSPQEIRGSGVEGPAVLPIPPRSHSLRRRTMEETVGITSCDGA